MVGKAVQSENWSGWQFWRRIAPRPLALAALVSAALLLFSLASPPARSQAESKGPFLGVASCAGSTCHGRMEGDGTPVRQDELMKWQEPSTPGGAHSRAFAVLSNSRSDFIAKNLGIGDPASAKMCLGCHSSEAAAGGGSFRYQKDDGVGCESCHGAAGGWIANHYTGTQPPPEKHQINLANGLVKLEDPRVRAALCVNCHFGSATDGQFVTHQIMAAGHPRIAFELDLFSTMQQHHAEDADYGDRRWGMPGRTTDHVQMWAVGQTTALNRSLTLYQSKRGTQGIFPEFYFFDCHSCHRRIFDQAKPVKTGLDNPGRDIPEGFPPYNDENMILLSAAAKVASPALAAQYDKRVDAFHRAMAGDRAGAVAAAGQLAQSVSALEAAFADTRFGGTSAFTLIDAIAGTAISPRYTDYEGSVQAVMGVDTLLNALVSSGQVTVGGAAGIRADIDRAYDAVKEPNAFRPADFQAALGRAARAIRTLQ
ncbi:MAG: hypothetical protein RLZZ58_1008 [Pseudomonadota bacterium]|jgi:hypothetical protein